MKGGGWIGKGEGTILGGEGRGAGPGPWYIYGCFQVHQTKLESTRVWKKLRGNEIVVAAEPETDDLLGQQANQMQI